MAIFTAQVAVSTTAAELTNGAGRYANDVQYLAVQAPAAAILYVGKAGVTSTTGFPIAAGQTMTFELGFGEQLYGVLSTGTGTAYTFRAGAFT